jgi:hypothetical protein
VVLAGARSRLRAPANTAELESQLELAAEAATGAAGARILAELLDRADAVDVPKPPSTISAIAAMRAKVTALEGSGEPEFGRAVALLRESERRVALAMPLLEQAEWLASQARAGEAAPLVAEARETFVMLRAKPLLERVESVERALDSARVPA